MKKNIALLMTLVLLILTACGNTEAVSTTESAAATTEPVETLEPVERVTVENPVTSFYMELNGENGERWFLTAGDNGAGGVHMEMAGAVHKVAEVDTFVLHGIADVMQSSGLAAMEEPEIGVSSFMAGALYVDYADGTFIGYNITGEAPEVFTKGFADMELYFARVLRDEPVYVPQPMVEGDVDAVQLEEMLAVLNGSGIDALDSFMLTAVAKDEFMGHTLGMSDTTHVVSATACSPMIQPNAYSFVIVQVDDSANIDAVRQDLAANLNWAKWVCVTASHAVIAQKGDLVLCLMGTGDAFGGTKLGIQNASWENLETFEAN